MAVFELGGALAPAIPELLIGPWTCAPPSFAAQGASTAQPVSLWRVELARDDAASRAALAAGEASVAHTHAVLDEVPRRLDRALAALAAQADLPPRPDEPAGEPVAEPAAEPDTPGDATHAPGGLERTLERIADLARGRARIETHLEGALVASSVMTLSGDTELWVVPRLSLAGAGLHARSVAVAVRTRHAWARVLTMIVAGVGRFMALGLPAVGVSALPMVWRFLRDVLREVRARTAAPRPAM